MAYQGRKTFTAGEVLTASDLNSTVDQTVMVFADAAARNTAIPSPTQGMVVFLKSDNSVLKYTGTDWEAIAPSATFTANRAIASDGSGNLTASAVTSAELAHVGGVTSAIQTQLNGKSPTAGSASITTVGTVTTVTSPTADGSAGLRKTTISTVDPSGGADGDVWLKYA
jgi:hypothetical protein